MSMMRSASRYQYLREYDRAFQLAVDAVRGRGVSLPEEGRHRALGDAIGHFWPHLHADYRAARALRMRIKYDQHPPSDDDLARLQRYADRLEAAVAAS